MTVEIKLNSSIFLSIFSDILGTIGSISAYPSALNLLELNLPFSRRYVRTAATRTEVYFFTKFFSISSNSLTFFTFWALLIKSLRIVRSFNF